MRSQAVHRESISRHAALPIDSGRHCRMQCSRARGAGWAAQAGHQRLPGQLHRRLPMREGAHLGEDGTCGGACPNRRPPIVAVKALFAVALNAAHNPGAGQCGLQQAGGRRGGARVVGVARAALVLRPGQRGPQPQLKLQQHKHKQNGSSGSSPTPAPPALPPARPLPYLPRSRVEPAPRCRARAGGRGGGGGGAPS